MSFSLTGICVTSHENAETYSEIFETLSGAFKYLMADGARAITLAKHQVSNNTSVNENNLDDERLMCWPHVFRAIS